MPQVLISEAAMKEFAQLIITHGGIRVTVYPVFQPNGDIEFHGQAMSVAEGVVLVHTIGHSSREKARLQVKRELTDRAKRLLEFVDADNKSMRCLEVHDKAAPGATCEVCGEQIPF